MDPFLKELTRVTTDPDQLDSVDTLIKYDGVKEFLWSCLTYDDTSHEGIRVKLIFDITSKSH